MAEKKLTEGEVLEILVKRCQNIGTVKRMRPEVLAVVSKRLAAEPGMTEEKVMDCCKSPMAMAKYF